MELRLYGEDVLRARALWTLHDAGYGSTEASVKCSNDCNPSLDIDARSLKDCMRAGKMVELNRERRKKIACTGSGEKREFSPTVSLLVPVVAPTPSETNGEGVDGLLREEEMAAYVTHTPASSFDLFGTTTPPVVTMPSAKTLGEWAGLRKIDSEGKARKVVGCSCVVGQGLWGRIGGPSSHSSGICQVRLSFASTGLGYSYKIFLLDRSQETGYISG
ncbi:hypothetical protein OPV22_000109 [Ensete ventricosum]|uniref:Uncharacterized protein n=1 Tax=Ensete ventricosum TaxID=4639 RepID=A0AAV8Q9S4_ENSVE|nr:hypothetical protein OPV22_000109 [Ensete ventricosum]